MRNPNHIWGDTLFKTQLQLYSLIHDAADPEGLIELNLELSRVTNKLICAQRSQGLN